MTVTTKFDPIHLLWENKELKVMITPQDNDRFVVTVESAILACKAVNSNERFRDQFNYLLNTLGSWLTAHADKIDQAYLTIRDRGLLFLPIQKSRTYDRVLSESFTDLDLEIANNPAYDLIELSVLGLPRASEASIASFINQEAPSLIYQHAN